MECLLLKLVKTFVQDDVFSGDVTSLFFYIIRFPPLI